MTLPAVVPRHSLEGVVCIGYLRVSTDQQAAEDRTSLTDQQRLVSALAESRGLVVERWFTDAGASGGTAEARPAFMELLRTCGENPRPPASQGLVLALNDSRWGRFPDPEESGYWRTHLRRVGWLVRFAEGDAVEDITARGVLRFIGAAQAAEYRKQLIANTRRGMRGSAVLGFWTREAPYGFRRRVVLPADRQRVLETGARKADGERVQLVEHEGEAEIIRETFARYLDARQTLGTIVEWLRRAAPARAWSRRTLQAVLQNPVYVGHVRGGRRPSQSGRSAGVADATPYGKDDAHVRVVDQPTFAAVQARLAGNRGIATRPARDYVLSGLVTCATCGRPLVGGGSAMLRLPATDGVPPERFRFYKCSSVGAGVDTCPPPAGTIGKHILEGAVVRAVVATLADPAVQRSILRAVDEALAPPAEHCPRPKVGLSGRRREVERQVARLTDAVASGILDAPDARRRMEELRSERDRLATADALERSVDLRAEVRADVRARVVAGMADAARQLACLSGSSLREVLRPWLARASFEKVSRTLTIAINPFPAETFASAGLGGPD